jgi:hypothetical protein
MSTSSTIGYADKSGNIFSIRCNWGGNIYEASKLLNTHYTQRDKVVQLVSLGNLCVLKARIEAYNPTKHSYTTPEQGVCVFYGRDRGEPCHETNMHRNVETFLEDSPDDTYTFLFDSGHWYVSDGGAFVLLAELLLTYN